MIASVTGQVDPDDLGPTLPHEHLYCDLMREFRAPGLLNDPGLMQEELGDFASVGGQTIIECTTQDMGRDPIGLRELSEATGVTVIMGTGHYRDPYLDSGWFDRHSADEIADELISDIVNGAAGSGVRAGIIGEIGMNRRYMSTREERSFRAAARAHEATGVTITTHAARWPSGMEQLDVLAEEGVDPRRVIIGHCDTVPDPGYHVAVAERGAFVQFDTIRGANEWATAQQIGYILNLREHGFLDRVLLSQDNCLRSMLRRWGGKGYSYLFGEFRGGLRAAGLSEVEVDRMYVRNPAEALVGPDGAVAPR